MSEIASPCVGICSYNQDGLCVGCLRNANEISDWFDLTDNEKQAVLNEIKTRAIKDF
jgi:predicted Fe-S protein YdhL (DUF1289 family)